MSSEGPNHDELDFEFLGNVSGEPYIVQTNLYINGTGDQIKKMYYSFIICISIITRFLVDDIPIREFANKEKKGVPYPKNQAMGIHGSLWNADDWATQGGRVKTNWSNAPFVVKFQSFEIDACEITPYGTDDPVLKCEKSGQFWWDKPVVKEVNKQRKKQLKWIRNSFLIYDYCQDVARFPSRMPKECLG
ncbi:hypothetical protein BUALT_Bualt07G0006800 [Buddleja alternifolia]|uniref:xyloglucan:xyloglucosyl transferase n=1 Tax=Buddleja alternifolia TaxID=168488 RepID=A0AAV6X6U3_9LAMI|nr:hypothetical protein BUALT_Bualt07G0006800 [Buddleja alternifolia]